ncbi:unnamed protein product [Effrenium voratum]|nr:unnamed protein product [Effrenium voratum]
MPTAAMEDERFDFKLVERMTFLEYLPVCQTMRSASCPGRFHRAVSHEYLPKARGSPANQGTSLAPCQRRPAGIKTLPEGTLRSVPSYAKAGSNETLASTQCSLEDAECTESPPHDREPEESVGSSLHPHRCKPCAWFWRTAGCARGAACQHCHLCLPGELVERRRQNRALAKSIRKLAKEAPPQTRPNN